MTLDHPDPDDPRRDHPDHLDPERIRHTARQLAGMYAARTAELVLADRPTEAHLAARWWRAMDLLALTGEATDELPPDMRSTGRHRTTSFPTP